MKTVGSLAETDFAELVKTLHESRWTGAFTLSNMGIVKTVTVQDGRMVFASSSSPDERLGELLLRADKITLRQQADAGQALTPGKRFGTVLVEQGILGPKDLVRAVVDQVQEIIYGAFQWTEGSYRLQAGPPTSAEVITLNISTPDMILEGIRRIESWSRIGRAVGGLAARYARTENYEDVLHQMNLSLEKLSILTELNDTCDLETICGRSSLPDFDVCRSLWAFRVIGLVRRVDTPTEATPMDEDEGLGAVLSGE